MRAREILQEDYARNLESDLDNLLVAAAGSGATQVDTKQLVDQLYAMGYAVDIKNIIPLLNNSTSVSSATPTSIVLQGQEADAGISPENDGEDSAEKVSDMAQDATDIG